MRKSKVVVTLSGGADSATILYYAMQQSPVVHAVSINYGQRHVKELDCARKLCEINDIPHKIIPFDLTVFGGSPLTDSAMDVPAQADGRQASTVVPYRNTFIAMIAAAYCHANGLNTIYMGPTYEDLANYEDCRPVFFEKLQELVLVAGTIHDLEIRTPFITTTKDEIVRTGQMLGVPYEHTWTCYQGSDEPCMICDSCQERMESFRLNGMKDPIMSDKAWVKYVKGFPRVHTTHGSNE